MAKYVYSFVQFQTQMDVRMLLHYTVYVALLCIVLTTMTVPLASYVVTAMSVGITSVLHQNRLVSYASHFLFVSMFS